MIAFYFQFKRLIFAILGLAVLGMANHLIWHGRGTVASRMFGIVLLTIAGTGKPTADREESDWLFPALATLASLVWFYPIEKPILIWVQFGISGYLSYVVCTGRLNEWINQPRQKHI